MCCRSGSTECRGYLRLSLKERCKIERRLTAGRPNDCTESKMSLRPQCAPRFRCTARANQNERGSPKHVLGHIRQNQVRRDRRDLIEACLAELSLDVMYSHAKPNPPWNCRQALAASHDASRREQRHVRLGAAGLARVEQRACLVTHQVRPPRFDVAPARSETARPGSVRSGARTRCARSRISCPCR